MGTQTSISLANQDKQKDDLETQVKSFVQDMSRLRRINSHWDAGLTLATIVLTLFITILTTLEPVNEQNRKVAAGVLGGIVVAIQSIGNAFPVKQRAGSYRLLQVQANNLLSDVRYVENSDELKALEAQFYQLRNEAAKTEM